ncbi:endonuclease/exonuclease/phosphatase family protein [Robertkochia solimangrovi]|uniref:endonuclease/exonuclease/phosphatase family protein n=1 Tax=Robertkochia solimangrovi TaxID=2213046 RepID=UPI00117C7D90|nr:endonuclease/exonuclease/phosphatase family protein [Robertkochia solimangrovi]TRZ45964.1 endonuclease [Robertkochia solimangrovi]
MKKKELHTVAFYNLENLFDTENNPYILDEEFTPEGDREWDDERYENKLYKLGQAIAGIGFKESNLPPAVVGVAEAENDRVLTDLLNSHHLSDLDYDFVHFDSPDERGIDTALLYDRTRFEVFEAYTEPVMITDDRSGQRDYTRDVLRVTGELNGERIHVIVNHWPSRREGMGVTDYKRIEAAKTVHFVMNGIKEKENDPSFIIMGDFNDDPFSTSIKEYLLTGELYNPMENLIDPYNRGSLVHNSRWNLFDQIIFSKKFLQPNRSGMHSYESSNIYNDIMLREWKGKYKDTPFRTFVGERYFGGVSDHFPVYIQLKRN